MKKITFHPKASEEMIEAAQYYEAQSLNLGSSFLHEAELALALLLSQPEAYPTISRRARKKPLGRFPYNVIYAIYPDRLRIVAVAHQKRRPWYWKNRLNGESEMAAKDCRPTLKC